MKKLLIAAVIPLLFGFSACKKHDVEVGKFYDEYTNIIINGGDDCAKIAKDLNAFADAKIAGFDAAIRAGIKSSQREKVAAVLANQDKTQKIATSACMKDVAVTEAYVRVQKTILKATMETGLEIAVDSEKEAIKQQLAAGEATLDAQLAAVKNLAAAAAAPAAAPAAADDAADDAGDADDAAAGDDGADVEDGGEE